MAAPGNTPTSLTSQWKENPFAQWLQLKSPNGVSLALIWSYFYPTKLGSTCLHSVKPIYWHWVMVKDSVAFITRPSKEYQQLTLKRPKLPSRLQGKIFKDRVRDQLIHILLIGWWLGNRESTPSTFLFQPGWGLQACGQHAVNFFHLMGISVSAKQLKGMAQNIIYSPRGGTKSLWLCLIAKHLLLCLAWLFSFVAAFSHFSD